MPFLGSAQFIQRQPVGRDNTLVERPTGFNLIQTASEGKTQISHVAGRYRPLVNPHQRLRRHMAAGFFQRFTGTGSDQRFALVQMAGGLIEAQPGRRFFLDNQKATFPLNQRGDCHAGLPTILLMIHGAILPKAASTVLRMHPDEAPNLISGRKSARIGQSVRLRRHGTVSGYSADLIATFHQRIYIMSMSDRDGFIWLDGKLIPWRDANTHVLTHSLHYGMSVFEGVRAYDTGRGTAIFRLEDHTRRLFNSAHIFQMDVPYDQDTINEAHKEVVRSNNLESAYIRPLVYYGSEKMGISPKGAKVHVAIGAWAWGAYLGEESLKQGIRVKTSSYTRHHVNVSMVRAKASGHYVNSILANNEAIADGYDEALLLDTEGYVSEGAGENLFIVKNGKVYTPELSSCLEGITRDSVVTLARELGISIEEKRITRDEVYCADEAFFTGTAAEVTPIRELDNRKIGIGSRGPVTERIQSAYFDAVNGRNPKHEDWLSFI